MRRTCHLSNAIVLGAAAGLAVAIVLTGVSPAGAQQADPFGAPPAGGADPFGAPEAGDFGDEPADAMPAEAPEPAAAPAVQPEAAGATPLPVVPNNPAVQAVLESHPDTPYKLLRAIRILADLGYPKLAQPFVDELGKQQLDDTAKTVLLNQFDSATLMRLARNPDLAALMGPYVDGLFRAADAYRREPQNLARWAAQLSDPEEETRARAILALSRAGEATVAPLVAILADPGRANEFAAAKRMLVHLDDAAIGPLVGTLESPDAALKAQVIEVLGALRAGGAVSALLYPLIAPDSPPQLRAAAAAALTRTGGHAPDRAEAMRLLEHAARRHLQLSRDESGDGPPSETIWHWNPETKQSEPRVYSKSAAHLDAAVHRSADLFELDPQSPERRRLYLTVLLEAAQLANGLGNPLPNGPGTPSALAAEHGPHVVEDVLVKSLAEGYTPAAIAASQILGDIGSLDLLAHGGGTPSALVRAASHADRRLRFAAIGAIMKLGPTEPFAGSSYVTEGLEYFARSYGLPRILIAHPLSAEGGKLAGLVATMGYEADVATNGRQAYELAVASPDYEMVLIHSEIKRPAADELLAQLRRDRRTAELPVGVMAPINDLERVERFARRAGVDAFLQPQKPEEMKLFVDDLLARAGRSHVTSAERRAQALAAMDWLVALAQSPQRAFAVESLEPAVVPLLYVAETAPRAVELLGDIGTDLAQRALLELAGSPLQPLELRKAAVVALARSIRQHGILLTSNEILYQYELYNANAGRDTATHEVLGSVLDVIETKGNPPQTP